MTKPVSIM